MFNLREITEKKIWEDFLLSDHVDAHPFFQSWNWGEVQLKLHHNITRLGFYNNDTLLGICLCVKVSARRGVYFHLRHGPMLTDFITYFPDFLKEMKNYAKEQKVEFIRMSPILDATSFDIKYLRNLGFRNAAVHNMDAENAWVLDLEKTEDELLQNMRKTTRYLVRKAEKMPIEITSSTSMEDFKAFDTLYRITSKRHGFVPHRGMKEELEIFGADNQAELFLAKYEGKVIAGAIIIFYGDQAIYHHAASDDVYRDIPAPYLLQWEIIKAAKKRGMKLYNFWGVIPENKPNHPWRGLTLFKTGFGGRRVDAIHAQDLRLSMKYWKTYLIETAWRIKRGY